MKLPTYTSWDIRNWQVSLSLYLKVIWCYYCMDPRIHLCRKYAHPIVVRFLPFANPVDNIKNKWYKFTVILSVFSYRHSLGCDIFPLGARTMLLGRLILAVWVNATEPSFAVTSCVSHRLYAICYMLHAICKPYVSLKTKLQRQAIEIIVACIPDSQPVQQALLWGGRVWPVDIPQGTTWGHPHTKVRIQSRTNTHKDRKLGALKCPDLFRLWVTDI